MGGLFRNNGKTYIADSIFQCDMCLKGVAVNAFEVVGGDLDPIFRTDDIDIDGGAYEDASGEDFALCSECYSEKAGSSEKA